MQQSSFHDFDPQSRFSGKYACESKSIQLRVSLRFFNPRYVAYYTIRVKGGSNGKAVRTVSDDIMKYDTEPTPLGRLEQPIDLIGAVLFFPGDESDFITGQTLVVNGGRYMH